MFLQRCRVCTECGVRGMVLPGSSQWFDNYSVCEACQCHRSSVCGVCSKPASPTVALQCCSICHRSVKCTSTKSSLDVTVDCVMKVHIVLKKFLYCRRWVHGECASTGELSEAKCTCLLCKEQQPVTQPNKAETQTREAAEESEGQVDLIEMTIPTDVDMVTEEHTDLSETTPGQRDTSEMGQAEATTNTEISMDLGNS